MRGKFAVVNSTTIGFSSETLASEIDAAAEYFAMPFDAKFKPGEIRQLALVAHNHMKPAMKEFI